MMLFLLLTIAFSLLALLSIGTIVFALMKKRRRMMWFSLALLVIGVIGSISSGIIYTKKAYDYVTSAEFQDDARKGAELAGRTVGSASSGLSEGLSSTLDDEAIAKLAGKSATILGKSLKTMVSNLDSTLGTKSIFIDENLADAGFEFGRAEEKYDPRASELKIFIEFRKDFSGKVKLTNYDQTGRKIDIAENEISAKSGEERVEVFRFPHSSMGLTTYYIMSKVD